MSEYDPMIRIAEAAGEDGLDHARRLLRSYAAEYAASIAETLCFQGFEAEVPGCRVGTPRPRGACCWRSMVIPSPDAWRCGTWAATRPRSTR